MVEAAPHRGAFPQRGGLARWRASQTDPTYEYGGGSYAYDGVPARPSLGVGARFGSKYYQFKCPTPFQTWVHQVVIKGRVHPSLREFLWAAARGSRPRVLTGERSLPFAYSRLWGSMGPTQRTWGRASGALRGPGPIR